MKRREGKKSPPNYWPAFSERLEATRSSLNPESSHLDDIKAEMNKPVMTKSARDEIRRRKPREGTNQMVFQGPAENIKRSESVK